MKSLRWRTRNNEICSNRFPGSNCDVDLMYAIKDVMGEEAEYVWHDETSLAGFDGVLLPGGFSYGDYLRCGAIARFSNIMAEVIRFAEEGKPVFGTCNGFQILTEAGLLPGVLRRNESLHFICKPVQLQVNNQTPFTSEYQQDERITIPVAHGEITIATIKPTRNWKPITRLSSVMWITLTGVYMVLPAFATRQAMF